MDFVSSGLLEYTSANILTAIIIPFMFITASL